MGLPADLQVVADGMIAASMELATHVMTGVRDTTLAVFHELDRQQGMAGADDAGRYFAQVYVPAAAATVDQMGFSAYMIGEGGAGLMRSAREFIASEDAVAASFFAKQGDPTYLMGNPAEGCSERFVGLGEDLKEVVSKTSWEDVAKDTDRPGPYRGLPQNLDDVSGTWQRAGTLMQRFLVDAQACGRTADKAHSGLAADAFRAHFTAFIGFAPAPTRVQEDETLVANLVAACTMLSRARVQYAGCIELALSRIDPDADDIFAAFQNDGGLQNLVLDDPWIRALGDIPHVLDNARTRVKLPKSGDTGHTPWYGRIPFLPSIQIPDIPAPEIPFVPEVPVIPEIPLVPVSLASAPGLMPMRYHAVNPLIPFRPPLPPEPGRTTPLSPADQRAFTAWTNGLEASDFGNGQPATNADNAYQLRVAGYPERVIRFTDAHGNPGSVAADGVRTSDGYLVDAKHVRSVNNCYRVRSTLPIMDDYGDSVDISARGFLAGKDRNEMRKYSSALAQHKQIRGVEVVTDNPASLPYWQTLMGEEGVNGYVRYVP